MANPVPAGSDVSAGTYECTNCRKRIDVGSTKHLPPCPECGNGKWNVISGGDAADDPYPDRKNPQGDQHAGSSAVEWVKDKMGLSENS